MTDKTPIIRKIKKVHGGGHHGGSWKVAYADFITASLCFFMIMWILGATDKDQRKSIMDYFGLVTEKSSKGSGGDKKNDKEKLNSVSKEESAKIQAEKKKVAEEKAKLEEEKKQIKQKELKKREEELRNKMSAESVTAYQNRVIFDEHRAEIDKISTEIKSSIDRDPELSDLESHLVLDNSQNGLVIQIVDQDDNPLFKTSKAELTDRAITILKKVAKLLEKFPNRLSISGYTDGTPLFGVKGYSNWELSSDRAHSVRKALINFGVGQERIKEIIGKSDSEPLVRENPFAPQNRRTSITLLNEPIKNNK